MIRDARILSSFLYLKKDFLIIVLLWKNWSNTTPHSLELKLLEGLRLGPPAGLELGFKVGSLLRLELGLKLGTLEGSEGGNFRGPG